MNAILTKLREALALVTRTPISVDLRPETATVQLMVRHYYEGVDHLVEALTAFLSAKNLWIELHKDDEP